MFKKISKITLSLMLLFLLLGSFSFVSIKTVDATTFNPNVTIPGSEFEHEQADPNNPDKKPGTQLSKNTRPIAQYLRALYNWGVGVVGVLAGVALIIAGMMWLTAGGNNAQVEAAKKWIGGALSGLVLALGSYFLLYQINPGLVSFSVYTIEGVNVGGSRIKIGCCKNELNGRCWSTKEEDCDNKPSETASFVWSSGQTCINKNTCMKYAKDRESTLIAERCEPGLRFLGDPINICSSGQGLGEDCFTTDDCDCDCDYSIVGCSCEKNNWERLKGKPGKCGCP